jgi:type II secretory pathway component PulC
MTAYQIAGAAFSLAANVTPATGDVTVTEVTGNLAGAKTPLFLKVTNTSAEVPVFFDADTASLSVATAGTVIGPGATEFIQVLNQGSFATVYVAASAASAVTVYVTPVTLVG